MAEPLNAEQRRVAEDAARQKNWKRWGPYLAERQWGTVREDYSEAGDCWGYFTHDHSRSRAYRWGEDGLMGITDRECRLCFALALWNGRDAILKERLFGVGGPEGNHGEDVKEYYFYLDSTPTHSYLKALYKYPQAEFPYARLVEENRRRGRHEGCSTKPRIALAEKSALVTAHETLGKFRLDADRTPDGKAPQFLFTDNETNFARVFGAGNSNPYVKDAFHEYVIGRRSGAVNPKGVGTKAAAYYQFTVPAGGEIAVRLRLSAEGGSIRPAFGSEFDEVFKERIREADAFYAHRLSPKMSGPERAVARQAYAGLLQSKQFYHYIVKDWLEGDRSQPPPPPGRKRGRNHDWPHLYNRDVISMPDKWEYPWYAAWDLAFHMVALAPVDPDFAKDQLLLFLREWYMHPNGQLPAYEFALGDVNPPVHAWAAWRVYKITGAKGARDRHYLARIFQKLLLNFTWWVNRKDAAGNNIFGGGFLG